MLILLSPGFPKNETDSTCLPAIQKIVLSLRDTLGENQLTVITLHYPFEAAEYRWHGVNIIALGGGNKKGAFRFYIWYKAWRTMVHIHKTMGIKGLLGLWLTETSLLAQWFGKRHAIKRIFWMLGQDVKKENRYVSFIKPRAEQLASMSTFSSTQFHKNHFIRPNLLFRNGIYTPDFPDLNLGARGISVMGAGSLIALKNYELFIDVLQIVNQNLPNLKYIHVGEGPLAKKLADRAKIKNLDQALRFMGNVPHAQVYELMNQSKVFLHTSLFEGSSTVMAEALYLGCKVVSTIGLEDNSAGDIAIGKTAEELANAVIQVLKSDDAPQRILSYNLNQTSSQIAEAFKL